MYYSLLCRWNTGIVRRRPPRPPAPITCLSMWRVWWVQIWAKSSKSSSTFTMDGRTGPSGETLNTKVCFLWFVCCNLFSKGRTSCLPLCCGCTVHSAVSEVDWWLQGGMFQRAPLLMSRGPHRLYSWRLITWSTLLKCTWTHKSGHSRVIMSYKKCPCCPHERAYRPGSVHRHTHTDTNTALRTPDGQNTRLGLKSIIS